MEYIIPKIKLIRACFLIRLDQEEYMKWFNEKNGIKLECIAVKMGKDLSLILTGGEAHLGSTALAIPRLSLNGRQAERYCQHTQCYRS